MKKSTSKEHKLIEKWDQTVDHLWRGELLYKGKSKFQTVEVIETNQYGKLFTLDGTNMLTERWEFIYHEMIVHPAFLINPKIKNVLIIGGGDGGTAREILKYKQIKKVMIVEIDQLVIDIAKKYFPTTSCSFNNPKLEIIVADGFNFVKKSKKASFDLVIIDSTDMVEGNVAKSLFTDEFYNNVKNILSKDGIVIAQSGNMFAKNYILEFKEAYRKISKFNKYVLPYRYVTMDYPGCEYFFILGSKSKNFHNLQLAEWKKIAPKKLRYFNPEFFWGTTHHPNYIKEIIKSIKK